MKERILRIYRGFPKTAAALCAVCLAVYAALAVWAGGSVGGLVIFWLAVALYIVLPGMQLARLSGLDRAMPGFRAPLVILLGSGFLACAYCVSVRLDALWLVRGVPLVLSILAVCAWRSGGGRFVSPRRVWQAPHRRLLALLFSFLVAANAFAAVIKYALPSRAGDVLIDQDLLYLVGNAKSFQIAFPPQEIRFYNVRLAYHYLTELLCAALSTVSGQDCYQVLAFYLQPAMLAALIVCLYRFSQVFYGRVLRKNLLFVFGLFCFGCAGLWTILPNGLSVFGNTNITHLLTNITSQTTATVFLCIFAGMWLLAAQQNFKVGWIQLAATLCAFVMLTVAKGPVGGLLLAGCAASLVFLVPRRKAGLKALVLFAGMAAAFGVLYMALFSAGANGGMMLSFTDSVSRTPLAAVLSWLDGIRYGLSAKVAPVLWVVQTALMAPALFIPWLAGLAADARRFWKLDAGRLLANACALGGLLAFFIFRHPHFSQVYFFLLALFFLTLLAVDGVDRLHRGWLKKLALFGAAVGAVTAMFYYVHVFGSGARYFLRDVGVLEKYPYDTVMNTDDEAAALWLRDNTDPSIRFATNRIHSDNLHGDGISNFYTALSGRQAILEGYTYVADTAPWMWVDERKADNAAIFDPASSPETVLELCEKHGVDYLVYSSQMKEGSEEGLQFLPCVFTSDTVRIYQLPEGKDDAV